MHIGIIMDGNRRWAKNRSLNATAGHSEGAKTLENIVEVAFKKGINELTVYALSTENYKGRSKTEIDFLLGFGEKFAKEKKQTFVEREIVVKFLGNISELPKNTQIWMQELEKATDTFNKFKLNVCVNYGGREEIIRAINLAKESNEDITEESFSKYLDLQTQPQLIIRTGGHHRLSNFLIWQACYSELYFIDTLWPDFNEIELTTALDFYKQQQRNFGK